jgi:hypothetical protein
MHPGAQQQPDAGAYGPVRTGGNGGNGGAPSSAPNNGHAPFRPY